MSGANALLNATGAAPGSLTSSYNIVGYTGSAAVKFGSGGITSIGNGSSNFGSVFLFGPNAYLEVGATNSNSALTGLNTIATLGTLVLHNGSSVTTRVGLNNAGSLQVDEGSSGGSKPDDWRRYEQ